MAWKIGYLVLGLKFFCTFRCLWSSLGASLSIDLVLDLVQPIEIFMLAMCNYCLYIRDRLPNLATQDHIWISVSMYGNARTQRFWSFVLHHERPH